MNVIQLLVLFHGGKRNDHYLKLFKVNGHVGVSEQADKLCVMLQ